MAKNIAEIKSALHHYIAETDDVEMLSKVQNYVRQLLDQEDKVVAYTSDGKPLTRSAYKKDIDEAKDQADKGNIISQDEMEKGL